MELYDIIYAHTETVLNGFIFDISKNYNINYNDVCAFLNANDITDNKNQKCQYIISKGINKGTNCPVKPSHNGFCGKHQSTTTIVMDNIMNKQVSKLVKKPLAMTKTQLDIIDWLNTAVPQEETILKKCSKGLFNEDTEIIFNDNYLAIGKLNNNKIEKLSRFEVEICEKRGWKYDETTVDSEDSE